MGGIDDFIIGGYKLLYSGSNVTATYLFNCS
jgi:hypothetical protein